MNKTSRFVSILLAAAAAAVLQVSGQNPGFNNPWPPQYQQYNYQQPQYTAYQHQQQTPNQQQFNGHQQQYVNPFANQIGYPQQQPRNYQTNPYQPQYNYQANPYQSQYNHQANPYQPQHNFPASSQMQNIYQVNPHQLQANPQMQNNYQAYPYQSHNSYPANPHMQNNYQANPYQSQNYFQGHPQPSNNYLTTGNPSNLPANQVVHPSNGHHYLNQQQDNGNVLGPVGFSLQQQATSGQGIVSGDKVAHGPQLKLHILEQNPDDSALVKEIKKQYWFFVNEIADDDAHFEVTAEEMMKLEDITKRFIEQLEAESPDYKVMSQLLLAFDRRLDAVENKVKQYGADLGEYEMELDARWSQLGETRNQLIRVLSESVRGEIEQFQHQLPSISPRNAIKLIHYSIEGLKNVTTRHPPTSEMLAMLEKVERETAMSIELLGVEPRDMEAISTIEWSIQETLTKELLLALEDNLDELEVPEEQQFAIFDEYRYHFERLFHGFSRARSPGNADDEDEDLWHGYNVIYSHLPSSGFVMGI